MKQNKAIEIIESLDDICIPDIGNIQLLIPIRALLALYVQKTLRSETEEQFDTGASEIASYYNIEDDVLKGAKELYEDPEFIDVAQKLFLEALGNQKEQNKGITEFSLVCPESITTDKETGQWVLDLEILNEETTKDTQAAMSGDYIAVFNTRAKTNPIKIIKLTFDVRDTFSNRAEGGIEDHKRFLKWDNLLSKASDSDTILVYKNGKETLRV